MIRSLFAVMIIVSFAFFGSTFFGQAEQEKEQTGEREREGAHPKIR